MRDQPENRGRSRAVANEPALTDAQIAFAGALGDALARVWNTQQEQEVKVEQPHSPRQQGHPHDEV